MLSLSEITKQLGQITIGPINMDLSTGGYFVLLGPSGAGKTVLLEMIAGLIKPDSGTIHFNNIDITNTTPESRNFSILYQDYSLFPHLTVENNIAYGLRARHARPADIRKRIDHLAEMLDITHLLKRKPSNLSGGEKQRAALARAIAPEPRLLLLDEPLAALDTSERLRLRKELKNLTRQLSMTVLHVTHDPEEALAIGDQTAAMLDHTIAQIGRTDRLFREPTNSAVAKFLGMSNVLPVQSVSDDVCIVAGEKIHASSATAETSHLWIGPEEIVLSRQPFASSARNQFRCEVISHDNRDSLLSVKLRCNQLMLEALLTHSSFVQLGLADRGDVYATFKSSAVHCF